MIVAEKVTVVCNKSDRPMAKSKLRVQNFFAKEIAEAKGCSFVAASGGEGNVEEVRAVLDSYGR